MLNPVPFKGTIVNIRSSNTIPMLMNETTINDALALKCRAKIVKMICADEAIVKILDLSDQSHIYPLNGWLNVKFEESTSIEAVDLTGRELLLELPFMPDTIQDQVRVRVLHISNPSMINNEQSKDIDKEIESLHAVNLFIQHIDTADGDAVRNGAIEFYTTVVFIGEDDNYLENTHVRIGIGAESAEIHIEGTELSRKHGFKTSFYAQQDEFSIQHQNHLLVVEVTKDGTGQGLWIRPEQTIYN